MEVETMRKTPRTNRIYLRIQKSEWKPTVIQHTQTTSYPVVTAPVMTVRAVRRCSRHDKYVTEFINQNA